MKALCDDYGLVGGSPHHCLWCYVTREQRALFWADVLKARFEAEAAALSAGISLTYDEYRNTAGARSLETIDADFNQWVLNGSTPGAPVRGVQAIRMAKTPQNRVARAVLHILALGAPIEIYKALLKWAYELDSLDTRAVEALELLEECKECVGLLEQVKKLLADELEKSQKEKAALKEKKDEALAALPVGCRTKRDLATWESARAKQVTKRQFNSFKKAESKCASAEREHADLQAQARAKAKELAEAKVEFEAAESSLKGVNRPATDGVKHGLEKIGVDTTRHFGESFVGGAAMKFLERRKEFFAEALRDVEDGAAKSIRARLLPLMALLHEINHEARRAEILSTAQMDDLECNIALFSDLFRATIQTTQATPKLHIFEAHMVEFMREWHTLGIFGEDAIESLHAKLNGIYRRCHGIRNRIAKQKSAWGLLDQSQHPGALQRAAEVNKASKRKFSEPFEDRKGKRDAKLKEKKQKQTAAN